MKENTDRSNSAPPPLTGTRVVDFTHFVAGPFCTMLLADIGAEVIKIEDPAQGDSFRHYPPFEESLSGEGCPFLWTNRNKKSVALNLKAEEGLRIARELVAAADVVVENFSSGVMERLGLDYDECAKINPRLIYCSVSAYGRHGEFADKVGLDPILQAESGFISMNGYADREGVRTGPSTMDISTAMMATNAILTALLARERTGKGQRIEIALYDTAITMLGFAAMQYLFSGVTPGRYGNTSPDTSPTGVFYAADGPFYLCCSNTRIFRRLAERVLDRVDLADDPKFAERPGRLTHRDELFDILGGIFGKDTRDKWQKKCHQAGVPFAPVLTLPEALDSPLIKSRGLLSKIPHPTAGSVPNIASPLRFSESSIVDPVAAPYLGQHTREVLEAVLNYSGESVAALAKNGVLGVFSSTVGSRSASEAV